jgi:3,4-dihydroxy 2-butanone 4-phosphate synthase / GTP cyclohydrolase II
MMNLSPVAVDTPKTEAGLAIRIRGLRVAPLVDLARLAGLNAAGVVCEVMNEDGTMARVPDLIPYCEKHGSLVPL